MQIYYTACQQQHCTSQVQGKELWRIDFQLEVRNLKGYDPWPKGKTKGNTYSFLIFGSYHTQLLMEICFSYTFSNFST